MDQVLRFLPLLLLLAQPGFAEPLAGIPALDDAFNGFCNAWLVILPAAVLGLLLRWASGKPANPYAPALLGALAFAVYQMTTSLTAFLGAGICALMLLEPYLKYQLKLRNKS